MARNGVMWCDKHPSWEMWLSLSCFITVSKSIAKKTSISLNQSVISQWQAIQTWHPIDLTLLTSSQIDLANTAWKQHFLGLTNKSLSWRCFKTSSTILSCSSSLSIFVNIIRLSIYTMQTSGISWNISFIIFWDVVGELHRPKYITMGSKAPLCITHMLSTCCPL